MAPRQGESREDYITRRREEWKNITPEQRQRHRERSKERYRKRKETDPDLHKKYWQDVYQRAKEKHKDRPTALVKKCIACKTEKAATEFSKDGRHRDGLQSYCKACQVEEGYKRPAKHRAHAYGLTIEEFDAMVEAQGGRCAICGQHQTTKARNGRPWRLCIDHDHTTGEVRGLLCNLCNKGIGCLRDDIGILETAAAYLRASKQKQEQ